MLLGDDDDIVHSDAAEAARSAESPNEERDNRDGDGDGDGDGGGDGGNGDGNGDGGDGGDGDGGGGGGGDGDGDGGDGDEPPAFKGPVRVWYMTTGYLAKMLLHRPRWFTRVTHICIGGGAIQI